MTLINSKYDAQRDFIRSIPQIMESEGTLIQDKRNLIKQLVMPDGTKINVKRYHAPRWINMLVYSLSLRQPKGLRAYKYAGILQSKGISTPEPIAYIEERRAHILRFSYFISTQCPYRHEFYELGNAPAAVYEPIVAPFAQFTAHIHDQGVIHRDFSPGNILWDQNDKGEYLFTIVDINRMYFGPVDINRGCANFARLWGPKRFIVLTVREYARLRHFDPDEAERIALTHRAAFWKRVARRHTINFPLEL